MERSSILHTPYWPWPLAGLPLHGLIRTSRTGTSSICYTHEILPYLHSLPDWVDREIRLSFRIELASDNSLNPERQKAFDLMN